MERMVAKMLRCYGREMKLGRDAEEWTVYGFFQSVTGKQERLARLQPGPLGLESRKQFLYLGPAEPEARQGDTLTVDGQVYEIRTAQAVSGTRKTAYVWAMCVEKGGDPRWVRNG